MLRGLLELKVSKACFFQAVFPWAIFPKAMHILFSKGCFTLLPHSFVAKDACQNWLFPYFQRVHSVMSFFPKDHFLDALDAMLLALFASCFNSFIVSFTSLILFAFSCKSAFSFLIGRFSLVTASFSLVPIATRTCWSLRPFCFACLVRYWFAFAKQSSKSAQTALVRSLAFLAFFKAILSSSSSVFLHHDLLPLAHLHWSKPVGPFLFLFPSAGFLFCPCLCFGFFQALCCQNWGCKAGQHCSASSPWPIHQRQLHHHCWAETLGPTLPSSWLRLFV